MRVTLLSPSGGSEGYVYVVNAESYIVPHAIGTEKVSIAIYCSSAIVACCHLVYYMPNYLKINVCLGPRQKCRALGR